MVKENQAEAVSRITTLPAPPWGGGISEWSISESFMRPDLAKPVLYWVPVIAPAT
jgi:hypothetical protein